jgi:hypothetical protein
MPSRPRRRLPQTPELSRTSRPRSPSKPRGAAARSIVVWQCHACGSPADPIYGRGEDSWCPSCGASGTICGQEGQFPFPHMYGMWLRTQRRRVDERDDEAEIGEFLVRPLARRQTELMKRVKTHTGTYHCPDCFIEFDLVGEESLACGRCQGPLAKGSLDDAFATDDDDDQDDDPEGQS